MPSLDGPMLGEENLPHIHSHFLNGEGPINQSAACSMSGAQA